MWVTIDRSPTEKLCSQDVMMWRPAPPTPAAEPSAEPIQQPTTQPQQQALSATEAIDLYFSCASATVLSCTYTSTHLHADSSNQWYALYKYGHPEDCSPHWQNFKHALLRKTRLHVDPAPPQPSRWQRLAPAEAQEAWLRRYGPPAGPS